MLEGMFQFAQVFIIIGLRIPKNHEQFQLLKMSGLSLQFLMYLRSALARYCRLDAPVHRPERISQAIGCGNLWSTSA